MYSFRKSKITDIAKIDEIISNAKALMHGNGLEQWQKGYPDHCLFLSDAEEGIGYVVEDESGVAAVCAIVIGSDPSYRRIDGAWLSEGGLYGAIHRVAVRCDCRGKGIPSYLFGEFEKLAAKHGAKSLRADTHCQNTAMRKSLEKFGFQYCGEIRIKGGPEDGDARVAYEKLIGDMGGDMYTFDDLVNIISELRSDHGCPWDKAQTHDSLKKCLAEESQEVFDAIDSNDMENLCEELGDVLLQVMLHSQIAREEKSFTIDDVVDGICRKMVFRHPHVFGDVKVNSAEESLALWNELKKQEKGKKP